MIRYHNAVGIKQNSAQTKHWKHKYITCTAEITGTASCYNVFVCASSAGGRAPNVCNINPSKHVTISVCSLHCLRSEANTGGGCASSLL